MPLHCYGNYPTLKCGVINIASNAAIYLPKVYFTCAL